MERNEVREGPIAIAVDKTSVETLKWAVDHYIPRGVTIKLVHVIQRSTLNDDALSKRQHNDTRSTQFLPMRCFCMRQNIQSEVVFLEDKDVAKALIEYINQNFISTLLIGASMKNSITRLFKVDDSVSSNVMRWAPNFCVVLVISKGRLSSVRAATRLLPFPSSGIAPLSPLSNTDADETPFQMSLSREDEIFFEEFSSLDIDTTVNISGRTSTDSSVLSFYENLGAPLMLEFPRYSDMDDAENPEFSPVDDDEAEKRRLKIELKETMNMYHAACKEALIAKERAEKLEIWKKKAEQRLQMAEDASKMAIKGIEKTKIA